MTFYNPKNVSFFIGRLTADPEERETSNDNVFARFSMAVNRYNKNEDGEREDITTFVNNVSLYGVRAEPFLDFVEKGDLVHITAEYQTWKYENDDGETRYGHGFNVVSWELLAKARGNSSNEPHYEDIDDEYGF